jgi:hypothetical protein
MGGSKFARLGWNAREVLESSDLMRMEDLLSREIQDELAAMGAGVESTAGSLALEGAPFSGMHEAPTLVGVASANQMTIGPGRGFLYDLTFPGLTANDSPYLVLRWAQQTLNFTAPDSTNARIDLIVATPGQVDSDLQSRSILVDPVTRSKVFQNVNKLSTPVSTISVVTGTPAGSPTPPAVPSHALALFEVLVPAGAIDGTAFLPARRAWRRAAYPWSTVNGPLRGCLLQWDTTVDPFTASAAMTFSPQFEHAIFIDGELISIGGGLPRVFQDSTANPFASAAPAGVSRPYYVYACGGRNLPQGAQGFTAVGGGTGGPFLPIVLVESTVAPGKDGHPLSNITTPRGATQKGAVYVGCGWVMATTSNRAPCFMTDTMTFASFTTLEVKTGTAVGAVASLGSRPLHTGGFFRGDVSVTANAIAASTAATSVGVSASDKIPTSTADCQINITAGGVNAAVFGLSGRVTLGPNSTGVAVLGINTGGTIDVIVHGWAHGVQHVQP